MIRAILGLIFGFVTIFIISFITLTACYLMLGQDRTFLPGSYLLTPLWLVLNGFFAFVAAVIGGKVCRLISARGWAVFLMALFALALGYVFAIPALLAAEGTAVRSGQVSNLQAMASGKAPKWFALVTPLISAGGVLIGGKSKKR